MDPPLSPFERSGMHFLPRRLVLPLGALLAAGTLASAFAGMPEGPTAHATSLRMTAAGTATNAGKVHRWGLSQWHDGFTEAHLSRTWKVYRGTGAGGRGHYRPRQVNLQHGMLTINGAAGASSGAAEVLDHGHPYGRWETRLRSKQYTTSGHPYRVVAALAPAGDRPRHCGAQEIDFSRFTIGSRQAHTEIRNLPNVLDYSAKRLDPRGWHDYAVEVTKTHISWFVDGRVVMTDRRRAALSGLPLSVVFRLEATHDSGMRRSRMQMDWIRYYTLARGDSTSGLRAPAPHRSTYTGAC